MTNGTISAVCKVPNPFETPPTRQCMVCDKLENPDAHIINGVSWLCPECKSKLKKLLEDTDA